MTATAPTPTRETTATDDVVHLVCDCQVGADGMAVDLPVEALCGHRSHEPSPTTKPFWRRPCPMCIDEVTSGGCHVCGEGN